MTSSASSRGWRCAGRCRGLQAGRYAGVPVANRALAIAKRALAEYGQSGAGG